MDVAHFSDSANVRRHRFEDDGARQALAYNACRHRHSWDQGFCRSRQRIDPCSGLGTSMPISPAIRWRAPSAPSRPQQSGSQRAPSQANTSTRVVSMSLARRSRSRSAGAQNPPAHGGLGDIQDVRHFVHAHLLDSTQHEDDAGRPRASWSMRSSIKRRSCTRCACESGRRTATQASTRPECRVLAIPQRRPGEWRRALTRRTSVQSLCS